MNKSTFVLISESEMIPMSRLGRELKFNIPAEIDVWGNTIRNSSDSVFESYFPVTEARTKQVYIKPVLWHCFGITTEKRGRIFKFRKLTEKDMRKKHGDYIDDFPITNNKVRDLIKEVCPNKRR